MQIEDEDTTREVKVINNKSYNKITTPIMTLARCNRCCFSFLDTNCMVVDCTEFNHYTELTIKDKLCLISK